ncbi:MAG: ECF transporter S component [Bacillota bacterium]
MQNRSKTNVLVKLGMLAALGVVLMLVTRFPLFSPYLMYDAGDIAALVSGIVFGPIYGLAVVAVTASIQAITVDQQGGWIGLTAHLIATGVFVVVSSFIYKKFKTLSSLAIGLIIGSLCTTLIMIPLNYFVFLPLYGIPEKALANTIMFTTTPFNLVKFVINSALGLAVFKAAEKFLTNERLFFEKNRKQK